MPSSKGLQDREQHSTETSSKGLQDISILTSTLFSRSVNCRQKKNYGPHSTWRFTRKKIDPTSKLLERINDSWKLLIWLHCILVLLDSSSRKNKRSSAGACLLLEPPLEIKLLICVKLLGSSPLISGNCSTARCKRDCSDCLTMVGYYHLACSLKCPAHWGSPSSAAKVGFCLRVNSLPG